MAFNNAIRRLVLVQGKEGDQVIKISNHVETYGTNRFTVQHLAKLTLQAPYVGEYDRAIHNALLNWTSGVPHGLIKHRGDGGLDAWRKLYN